MLYVFILTEVNATGAKFICFKNRNSQTVLTQSGLIDIKLQKEFGSRNSK